MRAYATVQDYYREQARQAIERRAGERRRAAVNEAVRWFAERRAGGERRDSEIISDCDCPTCRGEGA